MSEVARSCTQKLHALSHSHRNHNAGTWTILSRVRMFVSSPTTHNITFITRGPTMNWRKPPSVAAFHCCNPQEGTYIYSGAIGQGPRGGGQYSVIWTPLTLVLFPSISSFSHSFFLLSAVPA